jgi:hypothetical protein
VNSSPGCPQPTEIPSLTPQWQPWKQRTADGKSRSARNADKDGEWRKLREMVKALNRAMREHREARKVAWGKPVQHLTAPMAEA